MTIQRLFIGILALAVSNSFASIVTISPKNKGMSSHEINNIEGSHSAEIQLDSTFGSGINQMTIMLPNKDINIQKLNVTSENNCKVEKSEDRIILTVLQDAYRLPVRHGKFKLYIDDEIKTKNIVIVCHSDRVNDPQDPLTYIKKGTSYITEPMLYTVARVGEPLYYALRCITSAASKTISNSYNNLKNGSLDGAISTVHDAYDVAYAKVSSLFRS